jgi:hypothetical protein
MQQNDLITIFIAITSISIGVFFGVLGNRLVSINNKSGWKWAFYILGILSITAPAIIGYLEWSLINASNLLLAIFIFSILSGFLVLISTKRILDKKQVFNSNELDPIVNDFTSKADKNEIKLFGGDLNFFGNSPQEIDVNKQYTHLRSLQFHHVLILCETPNNQIQRIRYGKILSELHGAELRFYNPKEADLRVRGRIIRMNGSTKLLMYNKERSKVYKAIETDTSDSNGALYNNIWDLVWGLAAKPTPEEMTAFVNLFQGN